MKATPGELPTSDDWAFEVKWDGMRVLATCDRGQLTLRSGNGIDVTARFPELAPMADVLSGHAAVLDGEVVAFGAAGRPEFGRLQQRMGVSSASVAATRAAELPVSYLLFDVLWLDGHDTCRLPYRDRRHLLEELVEPGPTWHVPASHRGDGADWLRAVGTMGMEGLVAKRLDARYEPGRRSPAWRKIKIRRRQEVLVAGWLEGEGGIAGRLGALVIAVHDDDGPLVYAGRVGSGIDEAERRRLQGALGELEVSRSEIQRGLPASFERPVHHCRPEIVVEVAFAEWTGDGVLRHPSYLAQRYDVDPSDVRREPLPGGA